MDRDAIVVGGGVSGLAAALGLARQGWRVRVIERDPTPTPTSADEAFEWDRRGAPQVRHSHAFLARLRNLLREHYPDVLDDLLAAGANEMRFGEGLPETMTGYAPDPTDDELVLIACRRTTFEWVLRRAAAREGAVEFIVGSGVVGLLHEPGTPPIVTGVRLEDGRELPAALTVVANGRRSAAPAWLADIGAAAVDETVEDTGIVYFSRFYRLRPGQVVPPRTGPIGGDLGYLKYGVFAGDNGTFSITLATSTDDDALRPLLDDEATFDLVSKNLVVTGPYLDGRAEPITGVHKMAGLVNRWREYFPDGPPVALGLHVIGDARLCTNPLYGRGCSTGFWHAHLMTEAVVAHPDDLAAQAAALEAATLEHLFPWYRASVDQDLEARRVAGKILAGADPDDDPNDPRTFMRSIFREGLLPALRTDIVVLRAFFRSFNLLTPPDALMTDSEVTSRVFAVFSDRENRPAEPILGPRRAELLELLHV